MADPEGMDRVDVNVDALKSEIRRALINQKANACPIAMRMAWHAAGSYDKSDGSGGCNGTRHLALQRVAAHVPCPHCAWASVAKAARAVWRSGAAQRAA